MSINLEDLDRAATGDGEQMIQVRRRWLRAVHTLLVEGAEAKRRLADAQTRHGMRDSMDDIFSALYGSGTSRSPR
jgi:hypothetical protein